jgi:hypothetical protein
MLFNISNKAMTNQNETISYKIDEFLRYRDKNLDIPSGLAPYCYNNREFNNSNLELYLGCLEMVTETVRKKIDVNDVIIKNEIRYFVNTLNNSSKKNCNHILSKFKDFSKDYIFKEHIQFLAQELIVCAMRCPIGIKGIHKEKTAKSKSISENVSDVIKYFCNNITKDNNNGIGFHDELLKLCRKFFMDFVNLTKFMDQNNENTSDSYKGFMSLFGLMFENNLIPHKYIVDCFDSIKRTIFCYSLENNSEQITNNLTQKHEKMFGYGKNFDNELYNKIVYFDTYPLEKNDDNKYVCYRNVTECINFYKGYENFAYHYVGYYHKRIAEFNKYLQGYEHMLNILKENSDEKSIISCFEESELNCSEDEYENNRKIMIEKYKESIKNLKNHILTQISNLENFINSHDEVVKLNEIFKSKNKEQLSVPLKPHIMIIHSEISEEMNKCLAMLKNILEGE